MYNNSNFIFNKGKIKSGEIIYTGRPFLVQLKCQNEKIMQIIIFSVKNNFKKIFIEFKGWGVTKKVLHLNQYAKIMKSKNLYKCGRINMQVTNVY